MTRKKISKTGKTFKELYLEEKQKPTAASQFVATMAKEFGRHELTIRMWLSGAQTPDKDIVPKIEAYFGESISALFPNAKYDNQ